MTDEVIDILRLEGLAINGLVKEFKLVECEKRGNMRISKLVVKLTTGEEYETPCDEYPRISRTYVLLNSYRKFTQTA
ncbi:MAG: hypothetical protein QXS42_07190 [Zestosphaera sp.]